MNNQILPQLNDIEACVLCYAAYNLAPIEQEASIRKLSKMLKNTNTNVSYAINTLISKGFIRKSNYNYYWGTPAVQILDIWLFPAYCKLMTEHYDWVAQFEAMLSKRERKVPLRNLLLSITDCLRQGRPASIDKELEPYLPLCLDYITPWINDPAYSEAIGLLPEQLLIGLLPKSIDRLINSDSNHGTDVLMKAEQNLPADSTFRDMLCMQLVLCYYLERGEVPERYLHLRIDTAIPWISYTLRAMQHLEEQDYDEAYRSFSAALAALGGGSRVNAAEWFYYPILNFLYVITLAKCKEPQAKNTLTSLKPRYLNSSYSAAEPARVLACILSNREGGETPYDALSKIFEAAPANGNIAKKLAAMMCQWVGAEPSLLSDEAKSLYNLEHLTYEAYATQLASRLLNSLYIKPAWEKAIEQIILEAQKAKAGNVAPTIDSSRDTRLAYFFDGSGNDTPEVREQKRLKNGNWSSGKRIDNYDFCYLKERLYDEIDQQVKALYMSRHRDMPGIREMLPIFIGTDKLYYGWRAPYTICRVREEKPFLTAEIGKKEITLASNVPLTELDNANEQEMLFNLRDDGELCFYRVPLRVRKLLKALVRISHFPLEAEPKLKEMFEQIRDVIEIHSEMIEGGSTLPSMEGDSHLIIQAQSERGGYRVAAVVRPLPEGRVTIVPGQKEPIIFDQLPDGTRYQVTRNKKAEKRQLAPLLDEMEQLECDELKPCVWHLDAYQLLELMEWLPEGAETCTMEWPEGDKIKLNVADPSGWNIRLKAHGGWFDVEGEIPIDEATILSIGQLLELIGEGHGRFIRLGEGQFLSLTDSLRRQLSRIDAVAQTVRGKTHISNLAAGLIGDALNGELSIEHPEQIDDLRQRIRQSQDLQADVPATLNATLRDYQTEGFRWIDRLSSWGAGACLADDMGLGKTIQTIAFLLHKQADGPSLVVAPASVVPNWRKELARFAPTLQVTVLNELTSADRRLAVSQAEAGSVVVSTYGLLMTEEETMTGKQWNIICLDEAHSIKNASTKTSAVCMKLQAKSRLILTGTPIQNHLGELWNLFQFINPGLLGSAEQFTRKYIKPIEEAHDKARQQQLKRIVQPFMLRRTKQEVVAELPDKQEIQLPVQLSTEEMAIYELIRMEAKKQLESESGFGGVSVNTLAMITKLRMAACSAAMAQKNWSGTSSKLDSFCDLVGEICTSGNRVLVFSQFTTFLEMAKSELERRGMRDYLYLDGSTPIKRRSDMVDAFQQGHCPLFLISLKAGGLGLNLTGANYVIHLDPWWNPAIEQQATDRAYRIGQQQKVTVYHLISEHTIEEKIVRLHQTKRDLADSLLEGTDMSHKLSAADLLAMIEER